MSTLVQGQSLTIPLAGEVFRKGENPGMSEQPTSGSYGFPELGSPSLLRSPPAPGPRAHTQMGANQGPFQDV